MSFFSFILLQITLVVPQQFEAIRMTTVIGFDARTYATIDSYSSCPPHFSRQTEANNNNNTIGGHNISPTVQLLNTNLPLQGESIYQSNISYDYFKYLSTDSSYDDQATAEIQSLQLTPSKDDMIGCQTFWGNEQQQPQGYNGSQITHCYPLSAVGRLQISYKEINDIGTCTGAVIGAHTVLTAAHCFFRETTNVEFTPGQFRQYRPFGRFENGTVYKSEKFDSSTGKNDYAIVKFSEDIGALTGWLGVEYLSCDNFERKSNYYDLMVAGYANDKSDKMWTVECEDTFVDSCDESGTFPHVCDTNPGTSGAALIDNNTIIGIHSRYTGDRNIATYISREIMDFISSHMS